MFSMLGIPTARSTMNDLFYRVAQKLASLRALLFRSMQKDFLVQIDETSLKLTTQKKKAQVWTFVGEKLTGYVFDLTCAGTAPIAHLGCSPGAFVSDDYSGYSALDAQGTRTRCSCMVHARRGFLEAGAVLEAEKALSPIAQLYRVEHDAEQPKVMGSISHLALRKRELLRIFTTLVRLRHRSAQQHAPKTILGKAARYVCSNVRTLKRFSYDARIPPDNNRAENALRLVAVGRKNFLFVQSEGAGAGLALLYSLTTSCARLGVNRLDYVEDILDRIEDTTVADLRHLLPERWTPRLAAPPLACSGRCDSNQIHATRALRRRKPARTATLR
jgi:transposase